MNKNIAIKVENISKTFRIPHEKIDSVRGAAVNLFKHKDGGYEEFKALNNVSFEVKKGDFFGIIGRNGSGKSTLLKVLAGIYSPDKGKIQIDGMISPFLELGIGFNPELSGRDNIYLNATVLGVSKKQIDDKFDDIVKFSELERFIDQKLKNYSSGMSVRLAFSVAIHANRDILFMDEVLAVGDSNFQQKCLGIFKKLKKSGRTIIFVSHDLGAIKDFCDRVMLLNKGSVKIVSGPERATYEYSQIMMKDTLKIKKTEIEKSIGGKKSEKKKQKGMTNEILDLKVYNNKGSESQVFERGEDIIIKINFRVKKIEKDMFVGLGIIDKSNDAWICGNNTFFDKVDHNWKMGKNTIKLTFPKNNFNRGDFYILSSFFKGDPKENKMLDFYDSREKNFYFRIFPKDRRNGAVFMNHNWRHE